MKILLAHNYYTQPGGEDAVFRAEERVLRDAGFDVATISVENLKYSGLTAAGVAFRSIWSFDFARAFAEKLRAEKPDLCHFHNTFPLISPSAYRECRQRDIPVVQTLHNYRLLCPAATFYRNGSHCEECKGLSVPLPGVIHSCYRNSKLASGAVAGMLAIHNVNRTWARLVDCFVTPSESAKRHFVEAGFANDQIRAKPNFLADDPGVGEHRGGFALFVGRLSPEKGIATLIDAWTMVGRTVPLKVVGAGPLETLRSRNVHGVQWLGHLGRSETFALMKSASLLVVPSEWHETFGLTIIEAFAAGLPVVTTNFGAQAELVEHGRTGMLFSPGDHEGLAYAVQQLWRSEALRSKMGRDARRQFEERYTAKAHLAAILPIYRSICRTKQPLISH